MILRLLFFLLVFFLLYRLVKGLFINPYREGYGKQNSPSRKREGDVSIEYNPDQHRKGSDKGGEYVDYEELKD